MGALTTEQALLFFRSKTICAEIRTTLKNTCPLNEVRMDGHNPNEILLFLTVFIGDFISLPYGLQETSARCFYINPNTSAQFQVHEGESHPDFSYLCGSYRCYISCILGT